MITGSDLLDALPVIASLVVIESLLSVDNALGVAALASHLPQEKQKVAMRLGIAGAYIFRGVAMGLAAWIVHNDWIRAIGAVYLLYLMCEQLAAAPQAPAEDESVPAGKSELFLTVLKIEFLDLSLSLDNVIAAVAMSRKLWVVCTGVFIGILALRFLAGFCLRLLERFPVLGKTAFLLVGWVGLVLTYELIQREEIPSVIKFTGIGAIVAATLIDWLVWPLRKIVTGAFSLFG
jgi:tellurite resistance protein TerC